MSEMCAVFSLPQVQSMCWYSFPLSANSFEMSQNSYCVNLGNSRQTPTWDTVNYSNLGCVLQVFAWLKLHSEKLNDFEDDLKSAGGLFMSTVVIFSEIVFSSAMRKGDKVGRWVKYNAGMIEVLTCQQVEVHEVLLAEDAGALPPPIDGRRLDDQLDLRHAEPVFTLSHPEASSPQLSLWNMSTIFNSMFECSLKVQEGVQNVPLCF